jgi:hypothetical protein
MATVTPVPALSVEDLMTRGYFPDRVIPPINSLSISPAIPDILNFATPKAIECIKKSGAGIRRSLSVTHSIPKRKHLRRTLSIPNPLIQCVLSSEVASAWATLSAFCAQSRLSLSTPKLSAVRAVEATSSLNEQPAFRAQRSVGARYLLKTDIARYYPSIYTHSIPWALHTKKQARADKKYVLLGNRLDLWMRESQDKQTGGIPIGPDTSFIVSEVIGTAMDLQLMERLPSTRGTRSIDDYFLYFSTISEAERCIAAINEIGREFELEVNDAKTEIVLLPDSLEPRWKSDLRSFAIRDAVAPQAFDLLTLFDRAFEYSKQFPSDSVLTYAAKQTLGANIDGENWALCQALLLKAALAEPTMLSVLGEIYAKFVEFHTDDSALTTLIHSVCAYHAPLQQGNEVSWALWLAKEMSIPISKQVADKIVRLDDDLVALAALDLNEHGLFDSTGFAKWRAHMQSAELYENHWLIAYEALEHGWLSALGNNDYIADDEFFSILRLHGVHFYGGAMAPTASFFGY